MIYEITKSLFIYACFLLKKQYLCTHKISRSGAVVARWAHNPKVVRSSRASATTKKEMHHAFPFFLCHIVPYCFEKWVLLRLISKEKALNSQLRALKISFCVRLFFAFHAFCITIHKFIYTTSCIY